MFKKKQKKVSKVKAGEPLCFFEKEELEVIKHTVTKKGIASYCCNAMQKACEQYDTKETERYGKGHRIADSTIFDAHKNKIGIETHGDYGNYGRDYYNYVEFNYCPFCGTKINGYVEV